jgi:regulator of sirC expression with transglutaminase-like and TPR domain
VADDPTERFAALVAHSDGAIPLDEAALLIAAHALPDLDVDAQLHRLDDLAGAVTERTADGLRRHLVDDLGFAGDRATYHDADNSLLPLVLDRRRGIPLTLAVVAMEVGRRCDVPLLGIGMPGHFLLRSPADPDHHIDLFDGGAVLDRSQCAAIVGRLQPRLTWDDAFLDPVGAPSILTRMLANLAGAYRRVGDRPSLRWALELRLHLPGATERDRRELAVVLSASGRYREAATVLEATGAERDQRAADRLRARLN